MARVWEPHRLNTPQILLNLPHPASHRCESNQSGNLYTGLARTVLLLIEVPYQNHNVHAPSPARVPGCCVQRCSPEDAPSELMTDVVTLCLV